ncbi:DEAD/DEAH box helicase [Dyadobacter sp. CY326]|uniref:DEAD/DEAH box helicase n=1 Tax=Dyadobacter sp. CY326 TaxID=2907300 RepID=UPI001F28A57E|nr:DEAD/DEAH box helicase [Dyadobacter sp. CY326]MCE7066683.1 DEAD/DEAH box helicase [Dyadobacter sp. CY326]
MRDPIGSFETIKKNFIRYVETAFGTKFPGLEKERYALLNYDKVLYRKPWIEPMSEYVSSGKKISDLSLHDLGNALTDVQAETFKALVEKGLFPTGAKLHEHQAEMLREALAGNNCIITSGTGSGKTESFLLPLFAQLSKELTGWSSANNKPATVDTWWKPVADGGLTPGQIVNTSNFTLSDAVQQRKHETRPSGVRALVLYPMNALVEDQMSRLRKALDSDETRIWLNKKARGNAIFFGRYNGSSPIPGELRKKNEARPDSINAKKVNLLKDQLAQIDIDASKVRKYVRENNLEGADAKDLISFFQRLDGAEMRSRFDMQITPPDILITNYSMLSIMLMRSIDSGIFEQTKRWLDATDVQESERLAAKKDRIFHLIIDELHLYRGTQGTEVAYLLKLVLNRLGLAPNHPQVRILASSASLEPEDGASKKFLDDFFGIDSTIKPFKIIQGHNIKIQALSENEEKLPVSAFKELARAYDLASGEITNTDFIAACEHSAGMLASQFNIVGTGSNIERLLSVIADPSLKIKERLYDACAFSVGGQISYKAVCSIRTKGDLEDTKYFAETLFGDTSSKLDLQNALRGLLITRALFDESQFSNIYIPEERKLPRFRFHYFFRNIEGMWASVKADDIHSDYADDERTAGKLYSTTKINSEAGNRILELLYCDNCGTTMFGGSRLVSESGTFELLPISPNIEGIPEKTPAKLVEKRSYQEYALFWPLGKQTYDPALCEPPINQNSFWRQTTVNGFDQNNFEAQWVEASLNRISGDLDTSFEKAEVAPRDWIKGYYFMIRGDKDGALVDIARPNAMGDIDTTETHRALPNVCPCCGINHQKHRQASDKRKTSSIRGFRTGFAKTTQMFAKELVYQLPASETQRKLVVFSDSREDAAQVANGIERNHFTDLAREILIDELHKKVLTKYKIVTAIDANETEKVEKFKNTNKDEFLEVEGLIQLSQLPGNNPLILIQRSNANQQLEKIRQKIFSVRELVDITNSVNLAPLIKHLVGLGVNPGGNDINIQTRLLSGQFVSWYDLVESASGYQWTAGADPTFIRDLKDGAFTNLATIFFGSLFYSFESSALGYVCINPDLEIISRQAATVHLGKSQFLQIINSSIRILGDKYKHNKNDEADPFNFTDFNRFPRHLKRYITAVADKLSKNPRDLGIAVFNTLFDSGILSGSKGIIIEELFIKVSEGTETVWTSPRGKRPHLHLSGGICTLSLAALNMPANIICDDIWGKNYLSYNALKENREPIRLHCEELTGQTDNQFERQRHFRNIILPDEGNKQVKTIDVLSVTTTLEVGVDIGALQAVMLANMPPQRFNYQQRVGRAGRRGQAYSTVLTFCRGRSHDEFFFSNPHKITGDAPPTPFLTMGQERIFKRLLAKEILRIAFSSIQINVNNDEDKPSVHGEFGAVSNWAAYKIQIEDWIISNRQSVEVAVEALITPALLVQKAEFINWVCDTTDQNGLIEKAHAVINNEEISSLDISEKLAEGGILPMFGMPTTVKNLYHGINKKLEPLSINRQQSMAIYEFAPGAQKTKDKAIHTVIGFTSNFITKKTGHIDKVTNAPTSNNSPFSLNRWFVRCRSCGFFETYSEASKMELESQNALDDCPHCGEKGPDKYQKPVKLKSPRAYRTNLSAGDDSKDDLELVLSRPPIFAEKQTDPFNPDQHQIYNNSALTLSDKDVTWRINTNADLYFTGRLYSTNNRFPFDSSGYWFNDQWLSSDLAANSNGYGYSNDIRRDTSQDEQIALASTKKTEIFRVAPASVARELDLNMFSKTTDLPYNKAKASGVRSAYYSAAFLLQRVLADRLDVDPAEIEIADITIKKLDDGTDRDVAEIILTDELPNGSGFVRHLFNNFGAILGETVMPSELKSYLGKIHGDEHLNNCKDACYDCLKVFRNMSYHSLLDWRLGVSMMRIMNDPNYLCGADGEFHKFIEIRDWLAFATSLRDSFFESFFSSNPAAEKNEIDGLPVIYFFGQNKKHVIMIAHPFWDLNNVRETNWLAEVKSKIDKYAASRNGKVSIMDTFNLHRRPGWCYEKLIAR